jgi:predicted enzyme related to lactoylglutathione lyase
MFPIVYVDDPATVARFYCEELGFEVTYSWEDAYVQVARDGSYLGLARRDAARPGRDFELWLYVDDVEADAARLCAAGARELEPPQDMPWGERIVLLEIPDGTLLHLGGTVPT